MLFLDAGKGEVGGPNCELLSGLFFSLTFLVTPNRIHLLYLQELDSTANNRSNKIIIIVITIIMIV